jgi:CubicO group peptidase (beta-lactamase class C family)
MRTSVSRLSLSAFVFLAFFCARVIGSQTVVQEKLAEVEKAIEAEMAATKTPGAAVAVISGDKVFFAKAFGTTNAEG